MCNHQNLNIEVYLILTEAGTKQKLYPGGDPNIKTKKTRNRPPPQDGDHHDKLIHKCLQFIVFKIISTLKL